MKPHLSHPILPALVLLTIISSHFQKNNATARNALKGVPMKRVRINRLSVTAILAATVCWLLVVPHAHGQGTMTEQFDENGSMLFIFNNNGSIFTNFSASAGVVTNDLGPGGLTNALTYGTLDGVWPGDLVLREPGGGASDLIRWGVSGTLVFYSDNSDTDIDPVTHLPRHDLADTGLPGALLGNVVTNTETGLFGASYIEDPTTTSNGFVYIPTEGQPGYPVNNPGLQLTYIIISDVPEPGTVTLVGLSLAGLLAVIRRRK